MNYSLNDKSPEKLKNALNDIYDNYPCMEKSYDEFLFIAGFASMSKRLDYIDDLETLQLLILLDAVDRFKITYRDSNEYIKFLTKLLEEL